MREFTVVINECEQPGLPNVLGVRTRDTANGQKNISFSFNKLAAGLPNVLTQRQLDWLDVLAAMFAIDNACDRGQGDTDWARDITAFVPVRDPAFWHAHATELQELFNDLTFDRLRLHFRPETQPSGPPRQATEHPDCDCVALLSGGVDSFTGTLALLDQGHRPLLVSHNNPGTARYQRAAEAGLPLGSEHFVAFRADPHRSGASVFPGNEGSQRSRTMMFVGAAALAASALGITDVHLSENGVMAVHVPMSAARVGSLSTKTAAPGVVARMGDLATRVLGTPIVMRNDLVGLTKPEVVARAVALGGADTLPNLASCWAIGRHHDVHCGICGPCLMRRISFLTHGVDDAVYQRDVLDDEVDFASSDASRDNLSQLCQFVSEIADLDDNELFIDYPELLDGAPALTARESVDLYRRWADEALTELRRHSVPRRLLG
jgi:7-cyano-7-deazaguanine synthase in queuosine biosynthesis